MGTEQDHSVRIDSDGVLLSRLVRAIHWERKWNG